VELHSLHYILLFFHAWFVTGCLGVCCEVECHYGRVPLSATVPHSVCLPHGWPHVDSLMAHFHIAPVAEWMSNHCSRVLWPFTGDGTFQCPTHGLWCHNMMCKTAGA
jgi:hypothetical protein